MTISINYEVFVYFTILLHFLVGVLVFWLANHRYFDVELSIGRGTFLTIFQGMLLTAYFFAIVPVVVFGFNLILVTFIYCLIANLTTKAVVKQWFS